MINTYDINAQGGGVDWTVVKGKITKLIKSNKGYQKNIIGVVSDNYGDFTSAGHNIKPEDNPMPVALNGRVPVKVASDSPIIMPGDYITTSSTEAGKATKAIKSGEVIGKALEIWTPGTGAPTVMVYVEQGFYNGIGVSQYAGIEAGSPDFANQVLSYLITNPQTDSGSEILADRVTAGIELITPRLVASAVESGAITSTGEAQFKGLSFFSNTTTFNSGVLFSAPVEFTLPPLFNKDTAGFAVIKEGDKKVRIDFDQPYATTPIVTSTITFEATDNIDDSSADDLFNQNVQYIITAKDQTGFTIVINKKAPRNIRFSWVALGVRDAKVIESVYEGLTIEQPDGNTPPPSETPPADTPPSDTPPSDVPPNSSGDSTTTTGNTPPPSETPPADTPPSNPTF
jgi:hypothetical protein